MIPGPCWAKGNKDWVNVLLLVHYHADKRNEEGERAFSCNPNILVFLYA